MSRKTTTTPSTVCPLRSGADEYETGKMEPSLRVKASVVTRMVCPRVRTVSSGHSVAGTGVPSSRWKWTISCIGSPSSSSGVQPSILDAAVFR